MKSVYVIMCTIMLMHGLKLRPYFKARMKLFSSTSLILDIPVLIRGINEICLRQYDTFLFDQFGVLHNGGELFPGVMDSLQGLRKLNKTLSIVSNTSRRSSDVKLQLLRKYGLSDEIFDNIFTSGDLAFEYLFQHYRNTSCVYLSWNDSDNDLEVLKSYNITISDITNAEFIFIQGTERLHQSSGTSSPLDYCVKGALSFLLRDILEKAAIMNIPLICAISDITAIVNDEARFMPGKLSKLYEDEYGGTVVHFGKPHKAIFDRAIESSLELHKRLNRPSGSEITLASKPAWLRKKLERKTVLHVGDSIHHDILGASQAGIDSLFVTRHGVHRHELVSDFVYSEIGSGDNENSEFCVSYVRTVDGEVEQKSLLLQVCELCERNVLPKPTYIIRSLTP